MAKLIKEKTTNTEVCNVSRVYACVTDENLL